MSRKVKCILFFVLGTITFCLAEIPQLIHYQGWLNDSDGQPLNETVSILFKIYDSEAGDTELWTETHSVTVNDGLFSILLGSVTPIPHSLFNEDERYLALKIGEDSEMTPRTRLVSVGYSFRSHDSDNLDGKDDSTFVQSINGVSPDMDGKVELVPGSNITLTPDTSGHQVTISATLEGGGDPSGVINVEDGKLGIGKTDPEEALDVEGNIKASGKVSASAFSSLSPLIFEAPKNLERARFDDQTGNFGIGTFEPVFNLHVKDVTASPSSPTTFGIQWLLNTGKGSNKWFNIAVSTETNMMRNAGANLRFSTQDEMSSAPGATQMLLTGAGKLGIGVADPEEMLDVSGGGQFSGEVKLKGLFSDSADVVVGNGGGIHVSGGGKIDLSDEHGNPVISLDPTQYKRRIITPVLEITGGGDLAEPFDIESRESIKPGMIVAIHPNHPGRLRIADKAYDQTVAGIISGANGINPGLTMSQKGSVVDGTVPVALTGRVYAWADASNGSIKPGDLLTTSDLPGMAMKVSDFDKSRGAVLGKAMSGLEQGQGLVLVLVSLQ